MTGHSSKVLVFAFFVLVSVGISLAVVWKTVGFSQYQPPPSQTQEERYQELVELIEANGGIIEFFRDGEYDSSLLLMESSSANIHAEMKKYTRQVEVSIGQFMTEDEVKNSLGVDELSQEDLNSFTDGFLLIPISKKIVLGVLTGDSVLVSLNHFSVNIPPGLGSKVFVEAVLLPDRSVEDAWMTEALFAGSMTDFTTSKHKFYSDFGLVALERPEEKLLVVPLDYSYEQVAQKTIEPLDRVIYLRPVRGLVSFGISNVINTAPDIDVLTIEGQFRVEDMGSPVFVLKDGAAQWAGVLINITGPEGGTATVLGVESLKAREREGK